MTKVQIQEIENDTYWVKISFLTYHSQGQLIMKAKLYELRMKKIEKQFQKTTYWVDYNYQLTTHEKIMMDKEHQDIEKEIKRLNRYIDSYIQHNYEDNLDRIHELEFRINECKTRLSEIEDQIVKGRR